MPNGHNCCYGCNLESNFLDISQQRQKACAAKLTRMVPPIKTALHKKGAGFFKKGDKPAKNSPQAIVADKGRQLAYPVI
jgi:hypothetical protein